MTAIPYFFEAKQITSMGVTPQTPGAGGTLTPGTALDLVALGIYDRLTFEATSNPFEYSPSNSSVENYQPGKDSFNATLSQIDGAGGVVTLKDVYAAYRYIRLEAITHDPFTGTDYAKHFAILAFIADIGGGYVEGRNATTLTLRPCGFKIYWGTTPPF